MFIKISYIYILNILYGNRRGKKNLVKFIAYTILIIAIRITNIKIGSL